MKIEHVRNTKTADVTDNRQNRKCARLTYFLFVFFLHEHRICCVTKPQKINKKIKNHDQQQMLNFKIQYDNLLKHFIF